MPEAGPGAPHYSHPGSSHPREASWGVHFHGREILSAISVFSLPQVAMSLTSVPNPSLQVSQTNPPWLFQAGASCFISATTNSCKILNLNILNMRAWFIVHDVRCHSSNWRWYWNTKNLLWLADFSLKEAGGRTDSGEFLFPGRFTGNSWNDVIDEWGFGLEI